MKRIVRLTERDLTRIVKRVINESSERKEILVENPVVFGITKVVEGGQAAYRWYKAAEYLGDGLEVYSKYKDFTDDADGFDDVNEEKSLSSLFAAASAAPGPTDVDYKTKIKQLYNAMYGLDITGSGEDVVLEVMSSLKNRNQLSKLIHNWKSITGSDESLYDWLLGDLYAEDIWNAIGSWKDKYAKYNYIIVKGKKMYLNPKVVLA